MVEEISKHPSNQAMKWSLLAALTKFTKSLEQKPHQKDLENFQCAQKRSSFEVRNKEDKIKDIRAINKKPNTLHWDNRKDVLRVS
jgi:hypothetical protein